MRHTIGTIALALALTLPPGGAAFARGFGGGGGGGFRGGGGFSGGGFLGSAPSFSAPRMGGGQNFGGHTQFNTNANSFNRVGNTNANSFNRVGNTNANSFNRVGNTNANSFNRVGNTNANSFNRVGNTNVNNFNRVGNTNINNVNRVGNTTINGGSWAGRASYAGYHQGWVNGYWNGHHSGGSGWGGYGGYGGYGGWGLGLGYGAGLATGIAAWGFGSSYYGWGFSPYVNPYYVVPPPQTVIVQAAPYNYALPINTQAAPPDQAVADPSVALFDSARDAFKAGDYKAALQQTDQALATLPNDPALHEFRALVLFALQQYDQAAAPLYAVLAVGPGWNWTTMIGLYPNVDVYTEQLRALEASNRARPDSAPAHFVLAYHYLTEGYSDQAIDQLKQVVRLQPTDTLSPQLIRQFTKQDDSPPPAAPTPPANTPAVPSGNLAGAWTATPAPETTIGLTADPKEGTFTWKVTEKGKPHQFDGKLTYGDDLLTLVQTDGPSLVGKLTWKDDDHFTFQLAGGPPNDPGLNFSR